MKLSAAAPLLLSTASLASAHLFVRETNYTSGANASDVTDGTSCGSLTVLFARGTTEPGTLGIIVGPQLFATLKTGLDGDVALQGVSYPATREGNLNRGQDGGPEMARLANLALKNCLNTKLALVGYSQGAMVVRNAVSVSGIESDKVAAIVQFGDPQRNLSIGTVPDRRIKSFCRAGDDVCEKGTYSIQPPHLQYGRDADAAAFFLIETAQVGGAQNSTSNSTSLATPSASGTSTQSSGGGSSATSATAGSTSSTASTGAGAKGAQLSTLAMAMVSAVLLHTFL